MRGDPCAWVHMPACSVRYTVQAEQVIQILVCFSVFQLKTTPRTAAAVAATRDKALVDRGRHDDRAHSHARARPARMREEHRFVEEGRETA
jgi:hypothetical protein